MESKYKLSVIKDVNSLEELSKYDKIIRNKCKELIKCPDTAEDIVNDMYIKIHGAFEKGVTVNGGYVFITLKNLINNYYKKNNRLDFGNAEEDSKIPDIEDDYDEVVEGKLYKEELYDEMERRIDTLHWYDKAVLEYEEKYNLSELSRKTGISYRSLNHTKDKIKKKLGIKKDSKK